MIWRKITKLSQVLILGILLFSVSLVRADIIGNPPYKSIKIPTSAYGNHFDMVKDNNNVLYVSYVNGIKIFDGLIWHTIKIGDDLGIRRLYFDQNNRVYYGGEGVLGYVYKNEFGVYQFKDITPKDDRHNFGSIWNITDCNGSIVFIGLHKVFLYNKKAQNIKSWDFTAKLGAGFCYNNKLIVQDREVGLKELDENNWKDSQIILKNNQPIDAFEYIDDDSIFILSQADDWRIFEDMHIKYLKFSKDLPALDNYVSIESLENGKFVLGSNNGLLTFIDVNSLQAQSFQLTNDWIAKIIKTINNELIILTEFEIFYLQWPSPIRIQGKESGLASSLLDVKSWNNKLYVASSAGVFLEVKQQEVYQHKLFNRLNWTNKEAWALLPLNNKQILLAESHYIKLIEEGDNDTKITTLSTIIYPRELIQSQYNPNIVFVITENDVQLLFKNRQGWTIKPFYSKRASSIIEESASSVLMTTIGGGFFHIKFDSDKAIVLNTEDVSSSYNFISAKNETTQLILTQDKSIYAYNTKGIYKRESLEFRPGLFPKLTVLLKGKLINNMLQAKDGLLYGFTNFDLFYQGASRTWHLIDLSQYLKGSIYKIIIINNTIKVLSNGVLLSYFIDSDVISQENPYLLHMIKVELKHDNTNTLFAIESKKPIEINQAKNTLTFSFVLNDIKNRDMNQYRFQLLGDSDKWSMYSHNSVINVSGLVAGEYTLNIEAMDVEFNTYSMPSYKFIVLPPWYLTGIAKALWVVISILVLVLLFHLILKWRERIHEIQKVELKNIINSKTKELKQANESLQKMAHLDGLTELSNRFYLDEFIKSLTQKSLKKIVVMMLDMDDFKLFNDSNGHIAGDELLKKMARFLLQSIDQPSDIVARYGGEEFLLIMVDCDLEYVQTKAEEIRQYIEDKENKTSVSIGLCYSSETTDLTSLDAIYHLLDRADQAMYQAKNAGKNRIIVSE